ncbi:hypothetical protein CA54_23790 [Symmachiella macrocystis]|uniref:Thioredoxin domain-containing protein n=1 Tax=Symmachiella macrocystis TaxID=2527985 RepID=A0A5C6BS70_9PLAN|nr:hypothetical protein [Symmachiella macrocystis]TWU13544.1 hypothetical protein CA54_23790 [Symmachiella macrocystis]
MPVGKLRPYGRSLSALFAVLCGFTVVVGGFNAHAADPPAAKKQTAPQRKPATASQGKPTSATRKRTASTGKRPAAPRKRATASRKTAKLPSVKAIQAAYHKNFTKFMPLGVEYRMTITDTEAAIETERQRLKEKQDFTKANPGSIVVNGKALDEAQFKETMRHVGEEIQYLTQTLSDESVKNRLKGWVIQRPYVWTDGQSLHLRRSNNPSASDDTLFPGALTPPEKLSELYNSIVLASWSKDNDPPLRCWFGGNAPGQGRVANVLNDCIAISLPPMGFVKEDWTHKRDWHEWDLFMTADPSRFKVVKRTEVKGRVMYVMDEVVEKGERARVWIDPRQGALPLRMEWSYVSTADKVVTPFHRDLQILAVKKVANGFYPAKIRRRDLIPDAKIAQKQREEFAAGTLAKDAPRPPLVTGRITAWEATKFEPKKAIEPAALALAFPKGALYINAVDERTYRTGDSQPLPPAPQPIQPSQVAPPLKIAEWIDGKSRNLDSFKGKVVVLVFSQKMGDTQDDQSNDDAVAFMKTLQGKFGSKGVIFLEVFGAKSNMQRVRDFQKARGWKSLVGIDATTRSNVGASAEKYLAGNDSGFVVIGRNGRVAFNADALEEETAMQMFYQAAQTLSIPWPLDKNGPEDQIDQQQVQIFEHIVSKQIEQALAQP